MKTNIPLVLASSAIAALAANPLQAAPAQDSCVAAWIGAPAAGVAPRTRVETYRPVFEECHGGANATRLAVRRFGLNGESLLLTVDPSTLATSVEKAACWTCAATTDAAQADTRFIRAIDMPAQRAVSPATGPDVVFNAGLSHGRGDGSFITGDLCPSLEPLDRAFLEKLATLGPRTPVALSISGLWLLRHGADFQWLQAQARAGALDIAWVNHSYHHPYARGVAPANNYLLRRGFDAQTEILDTERLLIANGETPSVFFRFPGLYSDSALVEALRRDHLIVLGADGWLVFSPPLRPGTILLVHPNGNEPEGLRLFSRLLDRGRLPRPFRPVAEAP